MTTTIMVTGVGAIIGYGVLRCLRVSMSDLCLIGADIYPDAVGQVWCDAFEQAPYTSDPTYLDWLHYMIHKYKVDLIIPGIEQDVHHFSSHRECIQKFNTKVALNNISLINLTQDKWLMHQHLLALHDTSRIPSYLTGDYDVLVEQLGLPFLLKPRRSYASKGILKISSREDFDTHKSRLGEHLIAQPIIGSENDEYTVSVFGDGKGNVCAYITLQRYLAADGSTAKAWVRHDDSLTSVVLRLCKYFSPLGATNLQFRRDGQDWKLLEVNPRISSATSIRSAFGYNEAMMTVRYFLTKTLPKQPKIKSGFAVRFIEDHIIYDRDYF